MIGGIGLPSGYASMTRVTGVCIGGCADGEVKSGYHHDYLTVPAMLDLTRGPMDLDLPDMRETVSHSTYRWVSDLIVYSTEDTQQRLGAWVETRMNEQAAILHVFNFHASFQRNLLRRFEQYERNLRPRNSQERVSWCVTERPRDRAPAGRLTRLFTCEVAMAFVSIQAHHAAVLATNGGYVSMEPERDVRAGRDVLVIHFRPGCPLDTFRSLLRELEYSNADIDRFIAESLAPDPAPAPVPSPTPIQSPQITVGMPVDRGPRALEI